MKKEWQLLKVGLKSAVGARAFLMVSGFLVGSLLAKTVPDEDLGVYYLVLQIGTVAGLLGLVGTQTSVQRFGGIAAKEEDWNASAQLLRRIGVLQLIGMLAVSVALAAAWPVLSEALKIPGGWVTWLITVALALSIGMEEFSSSVFRAWRDFRLGNWFRGGPRQLILLAGLLFVLLLLGPPLPFSDAAWLRVAATAAPAALAMVIAIRLLARRRASAAPSHTTVPGLRQLGEASFPMAIHGLAAQMLGSVDLWTTGYFLGPGPTGVYASVLRIALLLGAFLAVLNAVLPTLLASMWAESRVRDMEVVLRRAATWSGWAALAAFFLLVIFGRQILSLAFAPRFAEAYPVLLALAGGQLWNVWAGSPGWVLQMTGHQSTLVRITLGTLALNVVLNLSLVRPFGMNGVAVATAVGLAAQNLAMVLAARSLVGVKTYAFLDPRRARRV